jgi:hypothetical protein
MLVAGKTPTPLMVWLFVKIFATFSSGVSGTVCPGAKVNKPLLLIESPVSAGVAVPDAYSKSILPDGALVSFETGSACQRKCCPTAALLLLLNADAKKSNGREPNPLELVAAPSAGNSSVPTTSMMLPL